MKVARTFTIDVGVVMQLQKEKNQSKFVEQAIRLKIREDERAKSRNEWYFDCEDCDKTYKGKKTNDWFFCPDCNKHLKVEDQL